MSSPTEAQAQQAKPLRVDDLLQRNVWDVDHRPHIVVDYEKCQACDTKPCTLLCPCGCYTVVEGRLLFSYEGCLECGTCRTVCPHDAIRWEYPLSGRGIQYRFS
ncbi:MAG: 4Fe-4S binding protein [Thermoproteota archaeon]